jgi:hypothetical protein
MGQTAKDRNVDLQAPGSTPIAARSPGWDALNIFMASQASQVSGNIDSTRENPRKSKVLSPSPKVHFGAGAGRADDIQTSNWLRNNAGANFSPPRSCNPLKTNDRIRFAAENGGKRRPLKRGFRASDHQKAGRGRPRGGSAPSAGAGRRFRVRPEKSPQRSGKIESAPGNVGAPDVWRPHYLAPQRAVDLSRQLQPEAPWFD